MNNKLLRFCLFFIASILSFSGNAFASSGELDVKELVLGHLGDAYEWHRRRHPPSLYCQG